MLVTMLLYAFTTVLTPFFSDLVILHILGFVGGFVIGIFEIGKILMTVCVAIGPQTQSSIAELTRVDIQGHKYA